MRSDQTASRWAAGILTIFALFVFLALLLALTGCASYNPAMFPSYDPLNPGEAVRKNPLQVIEDPVTHEKLFIVDAHFLTWVDELKAEIVKLRKRGN